MASWREAQRVDQAWIDYDAGRICVAAALPDPDGHGLHIVINSFDAASGARLWTHHEALKYVGDIANPIREFIALSGSIRYTIGAQQWTLNSADGAVLPAAAGKIMSFAQAKPHVPSEELWPVSAFRVEGGKLFAFTQQRWLDKRLIGIGLLYVVDGQNLNRPSACIQFQS